MNEPKPFRCFDRVYLVKLSIATLVTLGFAFAAKPFPRGSVGRLTMVGLESVMVGYIIVITVGTIRRLDEMNQRIHLEAIAASFTLTAVLGSALGLLERAGLPIAGWELSLWLFMSLAWLAGVLVIRRRYH